MDSQCEYNEWVPPPPTPPPTPPMCVRELVPPNITPTVFMVIKTRLANHTLAYTAHTIRIGMIYVRAPAAAISEQLLSPTTQTSKYIDEAVIQQSNILTAIAIIPTPSSLSPHTPPPPSLPTYPSHTIAHSYPPPPPPHLAPRGRALGRNLAP